MSRIKVVPVREVKCNFCQQWTLVVSLVRSAIYVCSDCLHRYSAGAQAYDQLGQIHHITFSKTTHYATHTHAAAQTEPSLNPLDASTLNQVYTLLEESPLSIEQKSLLESRISMIQSQAQAENMMDLIKSLSKCPSTIFSETAHASRSACFRSATKLPETGIEDFCSALRQTRRAARYQFHYGSSAIRQFKQGGREQTQEQTQSKRSFGTELDNFNYEDLYLSLARNHKSQSIVSFRSEESTGRLLLRLPEEQVKHKIDKYLQNRYGSVSLARLIASSVKQAYDRTNILPKTIELVSFSLQEVDLMCYLNLFEANELSTFKLINVGLKDAHISQLLAWVNHKKVQCLVLTCNRLTDDCLSLFLSRSLPHLKELYLGRNGISRQRMKENIAQMRSKLMLYV